MPAPIELEAPWVAVDLHGDTMLRAGGKHLFQVDVVTRPTKQLPSSGMTKDRGKRIADGADQALRLRVAILAEAAVNACHDEAEPRQDLVGIVERSVRKNVGLDSLEDAKAAAPGVEPIDQNMLLHDLVDGEAARIGGGLRMIGDAEVLVAALARCFRHLVERVDPVGGAGVRMQDAADIGVGYQPRQTLCCRPCDLVAAFAQLRW